MSTSGKRPSPAPSRQERIEESMWGRRVISAFVIVLVASVGVWSLSDSPLARIPAQQRLASLASRVIFPVGLNQSWTLFTPPRPRSIDVLARVELQDGSTETYRFPRGTRIFGNYRWYRWHKWMDRSRADSRRFLWRPTAEWIARRYEERGQAVRRVHLVRRWAEAAPARRGEAEWSEEVYYELQRNEPLGGSP